MAGAARLAPNEVPLGFRTANSPCHDGFFAVGLRELIFSVFGAGETGIMDAAENL
ncbi:hypothetical protein [Rhizobium mongolense]|uniref:Uncharacterized protein n=1 Tax=Rhizobium mongolense TaxID=57676 RepID=A0A7W6RJN3_9HYPH|nr:hypothetical protein [Rhizobium mongolense]MBB4273168.1 hypothetical protein [Rhizobium mongolense]